MIVHIELGAGKDLAFEAVWLFPHEPCLDVEGCDPRWHVACSQQYPSSHIGTLAIRPCRFRRLAGGGDLSVPLNGRPGSETDLRCYEGGRHRHERCDDGYQDPRL